MISDLKLYLYPNGKFSKFKANQTSIRKRFPKIYESIKDDYHAKLYMMINDIPEVPTCKNPTCNTKVSLKSISAGFRKFCSNKCIGQFQQTDREFSEKIRQTVKNKSDKKMRSKYQHLNIKVDVDKNYFLVDDYCKHSPFKIYRSVFHKSNHSSLCIQCNEDYFNEYIPTKTEIDRFQENFHKFYKKHNLSLNREWFLRYYPKELKMILEYTNHLENCSLSEAIYLFKVGLKNRPICPSCNKTNLVYKDSYCGYFKLCSSLSCQLNSSTYEIELFNYVKSLNDSTEHKFYLNGREYDMIVKDLNLVIEFNGLYWHGENIQKDKKYHYVKWKNCKDAGYDLLTIWEDDWNDKKELIKSMIKNKVEQSDSKIFARNTTIKNVDYGIAQKFLVDNHIQGNCQSAIRLGLYVGNELVSLMTFGKRKISNKLQYELLRFCSKQNTNVVGGASKLFKYFIDQYDVNDVISYANLDISNGKLYEILNFKLIGHTEPNYWWVSGKQKFHRSSFMKHKLVALGFDKNKTEDEIMRERGYNKLYGLGNLKFHWTRN